MSGWPSVAAIASAMLAAFLGAAGIGVLYRLPRRTLALAGLSGALTWTVYTVALAGGTGRFAAGFLAAATAAALAEIGARWWRQPATLLVVPAIVPLVPGADAYFAMLAFLRGDDVRGVELAVITFLAALSIAAGVVAMATMLRVRWSKAVGISSR